MAPRPIDPRVKLRHIVCFLEVARLKSVVRAADALNIPREDVLLAWDFTTQTTTETLAELRQKPADWNLPTGMVGGPTRIAPLGMRWWCEARIDVLMKYSDATLEAIRRSGCAMIFCGAESGSDWVLQQMKKGLTARETLAFVDRERDRTALAG